MQARVTRAGLSLREPRSPIYGNHAMIVSGHAAASLAGISVHRRGGNAVDAMIAASATLAVVLGHATSLGGDCFILIHEAASGRIMGLMPHPERFVDPTQHPQWTRRRPDRADGTIFFQRAFEYYHKA